jgi:hypothetical protein
MGNDLVVGHRSSELAEVVHHVHCHVVSAGDALVEENTVQPGPCRRLDVGLLPQLTNERIKERLAGLDPTARQVPASHIAMLDQEDSPLVIDNQRSRPERETPGKSPVDVQHMPDQWLKRAANRLESGLHAPDSPLPFLD